MENNYSVYMHTTPSNKRYIGITSTSPRKRWNNGRGYIGNDYFSRAINKYGWDNITHIILYDHLSKSEAEKKERELIAQYQTNNSDYGYNLTDGGGTGKKHSPETIEKMRLAKIGRYAGDRNPRFGVKLSDETRQKISNGLKGKFVGNKSPNYGKSLSDEQKAKISKARTGKHYPKLSESLKKSELCRQRNEKQKVPVDQFTIDGVFVKTWLSAADASVFLLGHKRGQSNICSCATGKIKTAYGYVWKHHNCAVKKDVIMQ